MYIYTHTQNIYIAPQTAFHLLQRWHKPAQTAFVWVWGLGMGVRYAVQQEWQRHAQTACVRVWGLGFGVLGQRWEFRTSSISNILQYTATHCHTSQHTVAHCNSLQLTATHCNTRQHTAIRCNTLQRRSAMSHRPPQIAIYCNTLQHTATDCNALQHTATQVKDESRTSSNSFFQWSLSICIPANTSSSLPCSELCTHTHWEIPRLKYACYNTLQTHRNTPQHTATHCNTRRNSDIENFVEDSFCNTQQNTMQIVFAVCHNRNVWVRKYVALCCNVLQCVAVYPFIQ